jgi:hypothetical protein
VIVVPDAGGVGGVGEGDGEFGRVTDAVGVGVGLAVGLVVAERVGVLSLGREELVVDPVAGRDVLGVTLPVWRPLVGAGDGVTPGFSAVSGCWLRSAAIKVPMSTSATSATSASRGSEAARRRPRARPVPGSPESGPPGMGPPGIGPPGIGPPGIGRGAVAGRWKRSGEPGGLVLASRAPLAEAVPGEGTAPLGGKGAPGYGVAGHDPGVAGRA